MKHTIAVTLVLVAVFFCAQVIGLVVTNNYIDHQETKATGNVTFTKLPLEIERPPVKQNSSFLYIISAILIATVLIFLLIKFRQPILWKIWFFLAVIVCLTISLAGFMGQWVALPISIGLALFKIFRPNVFVHNLTEVFIYGGLAAIFVPIMNIFAAVMLLILISIYDVFAVWKSGHMIKLAKFQTEAKVFAGLLVPYKRDRGFAVKAKMPRGRQEVKNAVLGGGDIGFPLMFAGVVMKGLMLQTGELAGFLTTLIIPVCAAIALLLLLVKAKQDKFYPAMPFISIGCFIGYGIVALL